MIVVSIYVFICQKQDNSVCRQILHELDDTYLLAFSLLSGASALTTNTLAPPPLPLRPPTNTTLAGYLLERLGSSVISVMAAFMSFVVADLSR